MWEGLQMSRAWERIHSPEFADFSPNGVVEMMRAAGYSEEVAQREGTKRACEEADRLAARGN